MNAAQPQKSLWATLGAAILGLSIGAACGYTEPQVQTDQLDQLASDTQEMRLLSFNNLGSAMGSPVASGLLVGAANEFEPPLACIGGSATGLGAPDLSYLWTAPNTATYTISTAGSGVPGYSDTVLHIYDIATGTMLGCHDNVLLPDNTSLLQLTLNAGQQIRIVVDSFGQFPHQNFQLNITFTCPTAPNACFNSPGTWNGSACVFSPKSVGTACNDGNSCTVGDVCNGAGTCGGSQMACNSPPSQCHQSTGTCSNGTCTYAPKSYGSTCNDGNACTVSDICNGAGSCGGAPKVCNTPPGQCYQSTGTCSNGSCTYAPKPSGTTCSPNGCWTGRCNGAGTCNNHQWLCSVGEVCRVGECEPKYQ